MKRVPYSGLIAVFLLTGCADKAAYQQQAHQAKPLTMPAGVVLKNSEMYYPVSTSSRAAHTDLLPIPSLVPPGSILEKGV